MRAGPDVPVSDLVECERSLHRLWFGQPDESRTIRFDTVPAGIVTSTAASSGEWS